MADKKRKSIAPQELGELPQEDRCPNCWTILSIYDTDGVGETRKWCFNCHYVKPLKKE